MDSYYRILTRIKAHFGARPLDKIRPIDIDRFYALLMSPNNGLSRCALAPASIERHHAVLHVLFKYALRDGIIKSNPMDRVECPREPEKELTLPDLDDVKAFLIDSQKSPCYVGICIAYYAALRRSEILGLKWSDIDMRTGRLHVRRVRQRLRSGPDEIQLNAYTHRINLPGMEHWIERDCTKSKHDRSFIMVVVIQFYLSGMRQINLQFRSAMGLFWHDRYKAVFEAVINLVASLILVQAYGVTGVIGGTIVSTVTTCFWIEPYVLMRYGIKENWKQRLSKYFIDYGVRTVSVCIAYALAYWLCSSFTDNGILGFIGSGAAYTVIFAVVALIFYGRTEELKYLMCTTFKRKKQ